MSKRFGIVLAGGRGERLGAGIPKACVRIGDHTLLERAVAIARQACGEVVVVSPPEIELGDCPAPRIADEVGAQGPLAGLLAGLRAAAGRTCAVLGVDLPFVSPELLRRQLEQLERGADWSVQAVVPRPAGVPQPLASAMASDSIAPMARVLAAGGRSLRAGLATLSVEWLDDAALARMPGGLDALFNVNLPEDLVHARRRAAAEADAPRRPDPARSGVGPRPA